MYIFLKNMYRFQVSETNARSDVISGRLDEVHARQVARSNDRPTTSNITDESPEIVD